MYPDLYTVAQGSLYQISNKSYNWNYTQAQTPGAYLVSGTWFYDDNVMLVKLPQTNKTVASVTMKQQPTPKPNITGTYVVSTFISPPYNESSACYIGSLQFDGEYDDPLYDEDMWIFFYLIEWTFPTDAGCNSHGAVGPYKLGCEVGGTTQTGQWGGFLEFLAPF